MSRPRILIFGASGLIGHAVAERLIAEGFAVVAVARRFSVAQEAGLGTAARRAPMVDLDQAGLTALVRAHAPDLVLNCVGALQDGPRGGVEEAHAGFVRRLLSALAAQARPTLLVHVSIPGDPDEDATAFSASKRRADAAIAGVPVASVILRPGFVIAPTAFGGSALLRGLAALPVALPKDLAARPFAGCSVDDVARTVAVLARRWSDGERDWKETWDLVEAPPPNVGEVVDAFRCRFGGPRPLLRLPSTLLALSARIGDALARLGWAPPVRSTALAEMARGVRGDPASWTARTGLSATPLRSALAVLPASVQERWFARLFLLKPALLACLSLFWIVSGLVALLPSYAAARAILLEAGLPATLAGPVTAATALADIAVGVLIAFRATCAPALWFGIGLSLAYLAGASVLAPWLWLDPVGSMVKTVPVIALMLVARAVLDER